MNGIPQHSKTVGHGNPVGVIGGGLAGLAAACVLGARGYRVILFEKNDWLGGKAAALQEEGFRFDMGPTILTCLRCCDASSPKPALK
jgi:diapolycopene oxygenase